jgi:hypothetical protein
LAAVPKAYLEASNGRAAHTEEISSLLQRAAALGRQQNCEGLPEFIGVVGPADDLPSAPDGSAVNLPWSCHGDSMAHLVSS